jgi:hypothetical protein
LLLSPLSASTLLVYCLAHCNEMIRDNHEIRRGQDEWKVTYCIGPDQLDKAIVYLHLGDLIVLLP